MLIFKRLIIPNLNYKTFEAIVKVINNNLFQLNLLINNPVFYVNFYI